MLAARLDALLYGTLASRRAAASLSAGTRWIDTPQGRLRVFDSGGSGPALLMAPDGPNVIEHHRLLADALAPDVRVILFDLPGFGLSAPAATYGHRLEQGAAAMLAVLDALAVPRASLAMSCVNGYYALALAAAHPQRVAHLILAQTPGLAAMRAWVERIVPRSIRVPGVGQITSFAARRRIADRWYRIALADKSLRAPFRQLARESFDRGGCFCFAGVVQGVMRSAAADAQPGLAAAAPATLIWGSRDRSHAHSRPESIHDHVPQARIVRFPAAGHFPELEQPQAYARLVRETLGLDPGPGPRASQ